MSSSYTDLLSSPTNVAVSFDNVGTEDADLGHVSVLKAYTDGTLVEDESIYKAVMENETSRAAFMKALMDNTKLSQSIAIDFPHAIEITAEYVKAATGNTSYGAGSGIDKQLSPPTGTRGFMNKVYRVPITGDPGFQTSDMEWIVDVYAYRHAKSNDVTVIVLHSGRVESCINFELWTTPETAYKFQYPVSYNSKLEDGKYSYSIDYTQDINMIGSDGKNPIVFKAVYKETFDEVEMLGYVKQHLQMVQGPLDSSKGLTSQIHGMSVFNASLEVGTSMSIEFKCGALFFSTINKHAGRVEIKV